MGFYASLAAALKGRLAPAKLKLLPRGYFIIGRVLVLKLDPALYGHRKAIGRACLKLLPYIKTVALQKHISGMERKPELEVLAGSARTETLHKEHGCSFLLDVRQVMWSKGNKAEKLRLAGLVRPGEVIVDMFAGIGYWSICIARHAPAKRIYAIEISPKALAYLRRNIALNKVSGKVEALGGDCRQLAQRLEGRADRIIMGWLWKTEEYLPSALRIAKPSAVLHFHALLPQKSLPALMERLAGIAQAHGRKLSLIRAVKVKGYAPGISHFVLDLKAGKA